jgi:leucyl-tRNA synthetase
MFAAPPEQSLEWSDSGVEGANRFLKRLWRLVSEHLQHSDGQLQASIPALESLSRPQRDLRRKTHETLRKVADDYGRRQTFNTAIAAVMELCNDIAKLNNSDAGDRAVIGEALRAALLMLNPIVPHVTQSLWQAMTGENILDQEWPSVDEEALVRDELEIVVQVNGKVRAKIHVAADATKDAIEAAALEHDNVKRFLEGVTVRKVIVVPGKLVNVVAN